MDDDKIVKFGTLKKMFAKYKELAPNQGTNTPDPGPDPGDEPQYDESTGRYTNESIAAWMNTFADGLTYGVRIPKYSSSTNTTAIKTDANENLVLNPSTNTVAGKNDYTDKKLFFCTRVNGGVDANGMPYITAIEGIDSRFSSTAQNTWALTPVYYVKRTETDEYIWNQFSDTNLEGFEPCAGAYTPNNTLRPYILRACYMSSSAQRDSVSGTVPFFTGTSNICHNLNNDFIASRSSEDGITYLTYGDLTYQLDFMQLMLGVKAPKSVVTGCISTSASVCNNGLCDNVKGTFGTPSTEDLTNGLSAFRFQNQEFMHGLNEMAMNIYVSNYSIYIAKDVNLCTGIDGGSGWEQIGTIPQGNGFISDYKVIDGASIPSGINATSTTGYMVYLWTNNGTTSWGTCGYCKEDTDKHGIGHVTAWFGPQASTNTFGTRISSIGHSSNTK